jgi:chromosome partitioning protein
MTYVIAFANQKGGVAKTTTAVSLAGALALHGYSILAIDLDSQADLTLSFGLNPNNCPQSSADILLNSIPIKDAAQPSVIGGLEIVPAGEKLAQAERLIPVRLDHQLLLRQAIEEPDVQREYDVVLLDCPPFLGAVTVNALTAADMLVIPTQPEFFSAHALRTMMSVVRNVRNQHNPSLMYRILITMHDRRNRIHRTLSEQIQNTFGDGLLRTVIDTDTKLRESPIAGVPINLYYANSRSTLQYQSLAQELALYVKKAVTQPA